MKQLIFKIGFSIIVGIAYLIGVPLLVGPHINHMMTQIIKPSTNPSQGLTASSINTMGYCMIYVFMFCGVILILIGILNSIDAYKKSKAKSDSRV